MKILFLDVDGVLNCQATFRKDPHVHFPIDPMCAFRIGKIQLDTDCKVVLSSSWRHHPESVKHINDRVVPIHDITGHCCSGIRGVEIHNWLTKNVPGFSSDGYDKREHKVAILDDDSDMLLWQTGHFFKTSFMGDGLTDEIAQKVTEHLNEV